MPTSIIIIWNAFQRHIARLKTRAASKVIVVLILRKHENLKRACVIHSLPPLPPPQTLSILLLKRESLLKGDGFEPLHKTSNILVSLPLHIAEYFGPIVLTEHVQALVER